jgi:hypothetical protein
MMENSSIAGGGGGGIGSLFQMPNNQQLMQAFGGMKSQPAVSPIMGGGVTGGGQPAPQANLAALQSNPLMTAIMQMIQSGGAGGRQVPGLGQILRGGLMRV